VRYVLRPWGDVAPWSAVLGPDGSTWIVLPAYDRPYAAVRHLADFAQQRRITVDTAQLGPATCVEPELDQMVTYVMSQFPGSLVLEVEDAPSGTLTIGPYVTTDPSGLARHMIEHHRVPAGYHKNAERMYEVERYHDSLHQQVMVYPLPVQHWHA
jgi:hypothetical protein